MTDNEIITHLELFAILVCETDAQKETVCSAIDLINRQQAEKEALIAGQETMSKYIEEQRAEIEELKEEKHILSQKRANIFEITSAFDRGRTDGIKKIADKMYKMITDIYNKHIFGRDNDLTDEEKDAIINYSDDIVSGFKSIVTEMVGETDV